MTQFCDDKGIKREYSIARTPQQNKVAKRRNRTLIEAARTMYSIYTVKRLVPTKSNSYYQAFNVKSLFGEIVSPKKSQVKLKCQNQDS
nr:putative ribonuclease H-like domain-containing protein [Tanacetum cinerariifolium]